ncbi:hypothetical protein DM02DRAFT_629144 [Periconia macrospinosa]|uniref:CFEM domain-containing protein n=1 Tax=Periconia macrospinosa TaxID=97972 RepID=A0A2V1DPD2_9PLEO|nr:hypothetical protein DM02DRAFT_629144 [Periconia macrospinosa]
MRGVLFALLCAFSAPSDAQDVSTIPQCGQYCVNTISAEAVAQANCNVNHANCYCSRYDFANKVESCANTTCTSAADIAVVNGYVKGYCGDAGSRANTARASSTTAPASTNPTSTPTLMSTSVTSPTGAQSAAATPSPNTSSGLSTGAKAGIGVGISFGVLALAGLFFALWCTRRKKRRQTTQVHEIDASQVITALPAKGMITELPAEERRTELPVKE